MFWIIKQVFIGLLGFSASLEVKCLSLNNELYMTRPTLVDLNPDIFNYYPFKISLDKCRGIFNNAVDHLSAKVCPASKIKGVNVKVFKIITRIN